MSCSSDKPSPSTTDRLRTSADAFAMLPPTASKQDVVNAYLDYRQSLFDAMIGDLDPKRYDVSWTMIKKFGDAEIGALQQLSDGSEEYGKALAHLQHLIGESYKFVPWG